MKTEDSSLTYDWMLTFAEGYDIVQFYIIGYKGYESIILIIIL